MDPVKRPAEASDGSCMTAATMPRVGSRVAVLAACVLALVSATACGGGGGPSGPTSTGSSAGPPARVEVQARGCHTTRTGEVDIQLSFDLPDRTSLAGYAGALAFHATLVAPTSWTTVSDKPDLIDRPRSEIFHLVVPEGEPIPPTLELRPSAEAVEAEAQVEADGLDALAGETADTPFGPAAVERVEAAGGGREVVVAGPTGALGGGVTSEGPAEATLEVGGHSAAGTATPAAGGASIRFPVSAGQQGSARLTLNGWTFGFQPDVALTVPVASCTAG